MTPATELLAYTLLMLGYARAAKRAGWRGTK